ncbi:hypothetical protein G9F72_018820 [Clostridium estertheticum]|uniref:hypothetical protein n=1 Tax=Clostridium estertheticum TaxID=238834 RepID=UPI0013E976EE|nr:hypothetical protein [Clostridium estertheticum]MBZ9688386.1 hypothetical protein [Clostridium estertheticum]
MSKFKELNIYVQEISKKLCANQNLCKLLYYNSKDALKKEDFEDAGDLINKNILFCNSVPPETESKTVLSIILNDFENDGSVYIRKNTISFNILTHTDLWLLDDGTFRVFSIMEELDTTFNMVHNKNSADSIGRLNFKNANHIWANNKYSGYTLNYGIWNHS